MIMNDTPHQQLPFDIIKLVSFVIWMIPHQQLASDYFYRIRQNPNYTPHSQILRPPEEQRHKKDTHRNPVRPAAPYHHKINRASMIHDFAQKERIEARCSHTRIFKQGLSKNKFIPGSTSKSRNQANPRLTETVIDVGRLTWTGKRAE